MLQLPAARNTYFLDCTFYCRNLTVASLEHVIVPASQTLYVYLARPISPVESVYVPVLGTVAITTPSRNTSTLAEIAPLQLRRAVLIPPTLLPEALSAIGPGVGVEVGVAVGVTVGVTVAVAVAVALGVAVAVAVAVGVDVAVAVGVGRGVRVAVGVGVAVAVGVGVAAAEPSSALTRGMCSNSGENPPEEGLV